MTPTTLLYHRDPHLLRFDGVVSAVEVDPAGRRIVVLRETAFYPEAGGQMADHGVLGGARVTDVQVGDDGVVRHIVEGGFAAAVGDAVAGVVDGARRRQHMAMHTAQHILSQVLLSQRARAETVSARLGETVCTVDVDVAALSDRDVLEAEDAVHAIVPTRATRPAGGSFGCFRPMARADTFGSPENHWLRGKPSGACAPATCLAIASLVRWCVGVQVPAE